MDVIEAIQKRRAIKHYDVNHVITEEEIQTLLSNTILSPTAFNIQNWRFVVVTEKPLRQKIREASWNQAQVEEASILIVLVADLMAWKKTRTLLERRTKTCARLFSACDQSVL